MRLWSLHPKYLDQKGLVALWRESLLAQSVLLDKTKGYKNHPQLNRFKKCVCYHVLGHKPDVIKGSVLRIVYYLHQICDEAQRRGYNFDRNRIMSLSFMPFPEKIPVTTGQLRFECDHLLSKLLHRDYFHWEWLLVESNEKEYLEPHTLFEVIDGPIEDWEKING